MRALKVLGIAENGAQIVCQPVNDIVDADPAAPAAVETFTLNVDERLRAAVRGDLTRIGQLEIEMESQLRPREIQQRIRAGSTVEQVAAAAGCSPDRIERYAYPVLLERSTIAQRARLAHPVVDGVTTSRVVDDVVTDTLASRGQQSPISWDAFRDERGWALRASWKAGRSENHATWSFHPGPGGGTVLAMDEGASMLVDPAPRPLRTVGTGGRGDAATTSPAAGRRTSAATVHRDGPAVERSAASAATLDEIAATVSPDPTDDPTANTAAANTAAANAAAANTPAANDVTATTAPGAADDDTVVEEALERQRRLVADTVTDARSASRPAATRAAADAVLRTGPSPNRAQDTGTDGATPAAGRSATSGAGSAGPTTRAGAQGRATLSAKRGQRPQMPSWEDVLLGTRTAR
jgi:hypothetical protein